MTVLPTALAQATLLYTGEGVPRGAANVLWFDKSEFAGGPGDLIDTIATAFGESITGFMSDTVALTAIRVLWGVDGEALNVEEPVNKPGGISGDVMPQNVAYLATKSATVGGRHGRGRMFVPGVPEAASSGGGLINGTYMGFIDTNFPSFLAKLTADDAQMVLAYRDGGVWTYNPVFSLVGSNVLATQRRRLRR